MRCIRNSTLCVRRHLVWTTLLLFSAGHARAAVILSDNLTNTPEDTETASADTGLPPALEQTQTATC